ncbi:MAG: hypothetical protein E7618_07625 [Ruminococcaceae bacterium]|nr:hypothetical protein [Oscillospiraceae bacterium]
MKFSLLQKRDDAPARCRILYDLSVDRAVYQLVPDRRRADYFLSVLEKPLVCAENITFRQEIYRDFKTIPHLAETLKTLFARYDRIKSDWQEMKLGAAPTRGGEINPEALLEHTFASLKVTAIFPSTITSFFTTIGETLRTYPLASEGLIRMRDWCLQMSENEALNELVSISQQFRYQSPEAFDFSVAVTLDRALRLIACDISDIAEHKKESGGLKRLFSKKKSESDGVAVHAELSEAGEDPAADAAFMLNEALSRIDAALTQVTNEVYEAFFGLSSEMMFYEAALLYAEAAEQQGVPTTMPVLLPAEEDCFEATGLRELVLLSGGHGAKTVPNDLSLCPEVAGLLVKGLTDSGKTVYLRAIGAAQLLAQAGLPVLAEQATMSIRHGFFSHFSSAEEEFLAGDTAGRFEQEAKAIAQIISELQPYSLLLLNETFQTTSYREGTQSMYDILRFMPKLKTKYVFVTHLTRLFGYMEKETVILARTSEDPGDKYKILIEKSYRE